MAEKKNVAKSRTKAKAPTSKHDGKAIESKAGAGPALAAHSKDAKTAAGAKPAASAKAAKTTDPKLARARKPAASDTTAEAKPGKASRSKATEKPSIAKRMLRKVKSAAGGVASLAGSVVGKR